MTRLRLAFVAAILFAALSPLAAPVASASPASPIKVEASDSDKSGVVQIRRKAGAAGYHVSSSRHKYTRHKARESWIHHAKTRAAHRASTRR